MLIVSLEIQIIDPFREVKSKLDKKKETKDSTESRFRGGGGNTSNRGTRSGTVSYGGRGGSTQFSSFGWHPIASQLDWSFHDVPILHISRCWDFGNEIICII